MHNYCEFDLLGSCTILLSILGVAANFFTSGVGDVCIQLAYNSVILRKRSYACQFAYITTLWFVSQHYPILDYKLGVCCFKNFYSCKSNIDIFYIHLVVLWQSTKLIHILYHQNFCFTSSVLFHQASVPLSCPDICLLLHPSFNQDFCEPGKFICPWYMPIFCVKTLWES